MSDVTCRKPDWEIRRELRPGTFCTYAHGYWRDPFVIHILGRTIIGKRALRKRWMKRLERDVRTLEEKLINAVSGQEVAEACVRELEDALREIRDLPSERDLLLNAVARAQYEIASRNLARLDEGDAR